VSDDDIETRGRVRRLIDGWLDSIDRIELIATVVLALAVIATTWSGFQSAKWSGNQAILFSEASAARTESTRASTIAGQLVQIDVAMFNDWLAALDDDIRSGTVTVAPGRPYLPDPDTLSGFLFDRFRQEFVVAVRAWLDTAPLVDADAPASPFEMPEYSLATMTQADDLLTQAEENAGAARQANQNSDNYVLTGVLFALVLFFAGTSSKLHLRRNRLITMGLAITGLFAGIVTLFLLPVQPVF
jgi:hypothetical protein